jgi:hypothetical protein
MSKEAAGGQANPDTAGAAAAAAATLTNPEKPAEGAAGAKPATGETGKGGSPTDAGAAAKPAAGDASGTPADDKGGKGAAEGKKGAGDGGPNAPEKYALKLPEGAEEWLDPSDLKQIETLARAKGWTNDEAQQALEDHADGLVAQSQAFRAATEADETYGGDKLVETQRLARAALDRVRPAGTPRGDALRKILQRTGYGNNVEIVSFLADLGKLMAEDQPSGGRSGGGGEKTAVDVLYGAPTK